jgi:hypothetical protein
VGTKKTGDAGFGIGKPSTARACTWQHLKKQALDMAGVQQGQSSPGAVMAASVFATCIIAKAADTGNIAKLAARARAQMRRYLRMQADV